MHGMSIKINKYVVKSLFPDVIGRALAAQVWVVTYRLRKAALGQKLKSASEYMTIIFMILCCYV